MTAEQIAAGLTKAQRRALLDAWANAHGWPLSIEGVCRLTTMRVLERLGLVSNFNLTPLGLEVRSILQETPDD